MISDGDNRYGGCNHKMVRAPAAFATKIAANKRGNRDTSVSRLPKMFEHYDVHFRIAAGDEQALVVAAREGEVVNRL